MRARLPRTWIAVALAAMLGACEDGLPTAPDTATLGGYGSAPQATAARLTDAAGRVIPTPAVPPGTPTRMVRSGPSEALALWVQDGQVTGTAYQAATGWGPPQPLESIYGLASDPQLASNGSGEAMAIWRHTVGSIESLRFSRFATAGGWATPDVMPGALPRPADEAGAAPQLQMDASGNAFAQWASGFDDSELQTARFTAGQGWSPAQSQPVAAKAPASSS